MLPDSVMLADWPQLPANFCALTTLRSGGVSLPPFDDGHGFGGFNLADHVGDQHAHVQHNRRLLATVLPSEPQWLTQVHGTAVFNVGSPVPESTIADAAYTNQVNQVCAVLTADCLPVLFCDPVNGVIAAAHAGWRGLLAGVLENTLDKMLQSGAQEEHILAWLGPAIGPLQFEVGAEVQQQFVQHDALAVAAFKASKSQPDKFYGDIYQLARQRLHAAGVDSITGGDHCTVSQAEKFYSYRRDGITGRMASMIWMKPE